MADLPELRLDDFYRDHDEPGLPVVRDMVDWDDVASWNLPVAVEALGELATTGHTVVPCYDISRSRADGNHVVEPDWHESHDVVTGTVSSHPAVPTPDRVVAAIEARLGPVRPG